MQDAGTFRPEQPIGRYGAQRPYTAASELGGGESGRRGTHRPFRVIDLTALPADPNEGTLDDLPALRTAFTLDCVARSTTG